MDKQKTITAYKEKKLTLRKAAELLGIDYYQMQELLEENNVPITDLKANEIRKRKERIKEIA
ncbi:MAG: UPF0175 family protein [Candidatus Micrarchaeota archaeon]